MAHHRSAIKRTRQNEKRRLRNRGVKTRIKTASRKLARVEKEGNVEAMAGEWNRTKSVIDKAAQKGVVHKKTASRKKSRLARRLNRSAAV